jgi:hypothetical protein
MSVVLATGAAVSEGDSAVARGAPSLFAICAAGIGGGGLVSVPACEGITLEGGESTVGTLNVLLSGNAGPG